MMKGFVVVALLLLQCACCVHSSKHRRLDRRVDSMVSSSGFIVEATSQNWPQRDLNLRSSSSCKETYGLMPCIASMAWDLFPVLVYGYLIYVSETLLTNWCDRLLVSLGDGIRHHFCRGVLLANFGSFADVALILVLGITGSKETAQEKVMVGMGLVAGSTVWLLTALWGACLIFGKRNISEDQSVDIDCQDTRGINLSGCGITIDKETTNVSQIMVCSALPFIILALRRVTHSSWRKRSMLLVACITAIIFLISYCIYQVGQPRNRKRREEYANLKRKILGIVPKPDHEDLSRIFKTLDHDNDGYLSKRELRGLILGLKLQDPQATAYNAVDRLMASSHDQLSEEEFKNRMRAWPGQSGNYKVYLKAMLLMLLGAIFAAMFGEKIVAAIGNFCDATGLPSFFISFIILPLSTKLGDSLSALKIVRRSASLTYSEMYGAVIINNTLSLAVLLAVAYIRDLDWDFSAEVVVTLLAILGMGFFITGRTTFQLWMSFIAILLYLLCLVIFLFLGNSS